MPTRTVFPTPSRRAFLGATLGAALAGGALTACSPSGPAKPAGPSLDPNRLLPPEGGPAKTPVDGVVYPPDYDGPQAYTPEKLVSEPFTLSVVAIQDPTVGDWKTNAMTTWYEERTGISVDWTVIPAGDEGLTKLNAMIASGNLPDVVLMSPLSRSALYANAQQGTFIDVKDIVAKYAPNTQMMLDTFPDEAKALFAPDGGLYGIPQLNDCYHCRCYWDRVWVHKPTMDALGLKMPTTTEEFKQVLLDAKKARPELQTYTSYANETPGSALRYDMMPLGAFGYYPGTVSAFQQNYLAIGEDGKVYVSLTGDSAREGLKYMSDLRESGAIDPATFNQTGDQLKRQVAQGNVLMIAAGYQGEFMNIGDPKYRDWVALEPFSAPGTKAVVSWDYYGGMSVASLISKTCKTPEMAAAWIDLMFEATATSASQLGIQGEGWDWSKPGAEGLIGGPAMYWSNFDDKARKDKCWNQYGPTYRSTMYRDAQESDPSDPSFEATLRTVSEDLYFPYAQPQEMQVPPLYLDEAQAGAIATQISDVTTFLQQAVFEFTSGKRNANDDGAWQAFKDEVASRGATQIIEVMQPAVDAFRNA